MIEQDRQALGASVLQAIIEGNGRNAPTLLDLGQHRLAYEALFWRPYLGANPFALYQSLVAFAGSGRTAVSVEMIARTLGQGDRYTILGRAASGKMPSQAGAAARLEQEGIVDHVRRRKGTMTAHTFHVLLSLPVLVPAQTAVLDPALADMHEWYLGSLPGFDLVGWREIPARSLVSLAVGRYGRTAVGKV